jgi:hypothetical protein
MLDPESEVPLLLFISGQLALGIPGTPGIPFKGNSYDLCERLKLGF